MALQLEGPAQLTGSWQDFRSLSSVDETEISEPLSPSGDISSSPLSALDTAQFDECVSLERDDRRAE